MPLSARSSARSCLVIAAGGVEDSRGASVAVGWRWPAARCVRTQRKQLRAALQGRDASSPARPGLRLIDVTRAIAARAQHGRLALLEGVEPAVVGVGVVPGAPCAGACRARAGKYERQ